MTRRGRRRRGRPKQAQQKQTEGAAGQPAGNGSRVATRRRRRGRRRPQMTVEDALQQMAGRRPDRAETLPPDGVVLEEVIGEMQQEYGTPSTPQEYRLILKVAEEPVEVPSRRTDVEEPQKIRLRRRRRRTRDSSFERTPEEIPTEPEDPQEIPPVI